MKAILGYSVPWSVAPGEVVDVKVSLLAGETYELDVVRVISGDASDGGICLDLRPMPCAIAGRHAGAPQRNPTGSCVIVPRPPSLAAGFELSVWVWPTTPGQGRQTLVAHGDGPDGFALVLDANGRPAWRVGEAELVLAASVPAARWTRLVAAYDPTSRSATLVRHTPARALEGAEDEVATRQAISRDATGPLGIAATPDPGGGRWHRDCFEGKLARPTLTQNGQLVCAWRLGGIGDGRSVPDPCGGHDGECVNLPARAVMGPNWTGGDPHTHAEHYDAAEFHPEDLYDAGWETGHRLVIPDDWQSGYYAVRLRAGDDVSYLPIFVGPPRRTATAPVAVLLSTFTSIAYGNYRFHMRADANELSLGRVQTLDRQDRHLLVDGTTGLSTYDTYRDGSGVRVASRLRPILNMGPGRDLWNLNADTHLLAWLDKRGIAVDVITDEDLHHEGRALLDRYRCVITGSHPEYWTAPMWDALEGWLAATGRLVYLGGNGFYWRTGVSADWPGAVEVRRAGPAARYWAERPGEETLGLTGERGGLWRHVGRAPNALVGVGTRAIGFDGTGRYRKTAAADDPKFSWIFAGVASATFGEDGILGAAPGQELDAADRALGTPDSAVVLARSEGHSAAMMPVPEDMLMPHPGMAAPTNPAVCSEIVYLPTAGGGEVFSVGSVSWLAALAANGFDNDVARITENVLARFSEAAPA